MPEEQIACKVFCLVWMERWLTHYLPSNARGVAGPIVLTLAHDEVLGFYSWQTGDHLVAAFLWRQCQIGRREAAAESLRAR